MAPGESPYFFRKGKMHFFCPLCRVHQSTSTAQRISWVHHAQISILTTVSLFVLFPWCGWNSVAFYLVFWGAFEFFHRLRKRQALVCRSCGFDPFLFRQDVHRARAALKLHWESRIEKENLFSRLKLKNYKTGPDRLREPGPSTDVAASNEVPSERGAPSHVAQP